MLRASCEIGPGEIAKSMQESPGLPAGSRPHGEPRESVCRPMWITDDLLAETQTVWSRAYGRAIGADEAVEILTNVKRLAEVLVKSRRGGKSA